MAPRKRARARASDEDIELASLPDTFGTPEMRAPTLTEERRERELEDILEELGTDGRVKVWQVIDGKSAYAGEITADGFNLDVLLDTFGGGDKTLVIYQGRSKKETVRVSLDPSIPPKNPRTPKSVAVTAASGTAGLGDMAAVLASMAQMSMNQMAASQQMMTGMVGAMTQLMTVQPRTDPTETALKIAEVLRQGSGGGNLVDAMTMFEKGIALGERMSGPEGDGVMDVVGKGMDTLAVIVQGLVADRQAKALAASNGGSTGPSVGVGASVPDGNAAPVPTPSPTTLRRLNTGRPWVQAVAPHIGRLVAVAGFASPSMAADTVADKLTDDEFGDLLDDIQDGTDGGFGARLYEYFPEMRAVDPEWTGKVIEHLLTDHVDDVSDEDDASAQQSAANMNGSERRPVPDATNR